MLIFWAISTVVFQSDILTLGFLFICSSRVSHRRITNDSFYSLKDWLSLSVSGAKGSWTLDLLCARQMLSQLSYSPITSLFYFERPLANFSKTSFCFNRNEAQYEEKPNHGFHILDFCRLLMWFIFLPAYADIFLSSYWTRVRKHTLRNLPKSTLSSSRT